MSGKRGIKFKIILNSFLSILIFAVFLLWISNIYWESLMHNKKDILQDIVQVGKTVTSHFIELEKKGTLSRDEAQTKAKEIINAIRYGGNEYIFITNTKAYQVLNPVKPELSGKDMSQFKDPNGFKLYIELANLAQKSGTGFIEYMFPKAGSSVPIAKLSFIHYFPEWDWIVGTGLYMDDVTNSMTKFLRILLFSCLFCIVTFVLVGLFFANSVVKPLAEVCLSLVNASNSLLQKSDELKVSSGRVKAFSKEQESSIQTTAAAISEITSMIGKTTQLTSSSAELANSISGKAEKVEVSMKDLIASMKGIQEASSKLKEIEKIINEIESKTKVINEIVSKTELLSLNAAIEAARAGEHGKGFSIVAEEVGNLAQMSGAAAKEINNLLEQSLKKVHTVVEDVKNKIDESLTSARKSVTTGSKTVENCRNVLEEIQAYSAQLNNMVTSISTASLESSLGVEEISKALMKLNSATQINAKAANCCSDAYSILSEQVHKLRTSATSLRQVIGGNLILDKFIWKDAYALDIPSMDGEHKILINKINNLADAFAQKSDLKSAFQDLAEYTQKHFAHEEDYMRSISYPSLNSHQKLHTNLLAQVKKFGEQINSETINPDELMNFLNDWLLRHILGTDMKYAKYVKEGNNDFKNTF